MTEIYTQTLKYFHLAISEFLPRLNELKDTIKDQKIKEEIEDLIEAYQDIDVKIISYNLNYDDPNRGYDGEPYEIEIDIPSNMVENLARLTHRLFLAWKQNLSRLEKKNYLTEENKTQIKKLKNLIWPLEALMKDSSFVVGKYANLGPIEFPNENETQRAQNDKADIKTIKNRFKTEGLFIESRTQGEDLHLLIGKRDGSGEKAHAVVDAKTGDIRVEDNQKEPLDLIQKIESILTLPGGKKIRITRESIEELSSENKDDHSAVIEKQINVFKKNRANFNSGRNSNK